MSQVRWTRKFPRGPRVPQPLGNTATIGYTAPAATVGYVHLLPKRDRPLSRTLRSRYHRRVQQWRGVNPFTTIHSHFRFYEDDALEGTPLANEDTSINVEKNTPFHLRFQVDTTETASTTRYVVQFRLGGASFENVPIEAESVGQAFHIPLSTVIPTGGAFSTAQLTAPAGKTSGTHFTPGRIRDNQNPTILSTYFGYAEYTEHVWVIEAATSAIATGVYEFRIAQIHPVTEAVVPLTTYSITPTVTVGSNPTLDPFPAITVVADVPEQEAILDSYAEFVFVSGLGAITLIDMPLVLVDESPEVEKDLFESVIFALPSEEFFAPAPPGPGNCISLLKEDEIIRMLDQDFTILTTSQYYTVYINETKTGAIIRVGGYGHQQS